MDKEKELFPVIHQGKQWEKKECDTTFLCFYSTKISLNEDGGVYLSDGMWVYPSGLIEKY